MKAFFTILFYLFALNTFAQKVDTIEFHYSKYSFAKTEEIRKYNLKAFLYKLGYNVIRFNGKDSLYENVYEEVGKEEYDAFIKQEQDFGNCNSCWQKIYNKEGILVREGLYKTDCPIGETKTYNSKSGNLITHCQWRLLNEKEKNIFKNRCSIKTGDWFYFKADGSKEKVEKYKEDVLIVSIKF